MRRSGGKKRERRPGGDPPDWPFLLGVGGLLVTILGGSAGGPVGGVMADLGCATTVIGAVAFFGLAIEGRYARKKKG